MGKRTVNVPGGPKYVFGRLNTAWQPSQASVDKNIDLHSDSGSIMSEIDIPQEQEERDTGYLFTEVQEAKKFAAQGYKEDNGEFDMSQYSRFDKIFRSGAIRRAREDHEKQKQEIKQHNELFRAARDMLEDYDSFMYRADNYHIPTVTPGDELYNTVQEFNEQSGKLVDRLYTLKLNINKLRGYNSGMEDYESYYANETGMDIAELFDDAKRYQKEYSEKRKEFFDKYEKQIDDISRGMAQSLMPEGEYFSDYYSRTEKKHFGDPTGPGSQFTKYNNLEELLSAAIKDYATDIEVDRTNALVSSYLRDDRDDFIARGYNPESFRDGTRYLMVKSNNGPIGVLGSSDTTQHSDDTVIEPIQKTDRGEFRFSVAMDKKPEVDFATIVISDKPDKTNMSEGMWGDLEKNYEPGDMPDSVFITAYPGGPGGYRGAIRQKDNPEGYAWLEERVKSGQPLTIGEVKEKLWGGKDFGLNVSVKG